MTDRDVLLAAGDKADAKYKFSTSVGKKRRAIQELCCNIYHDIDILFRFEMGRSAKNMAYRLQN